MKNQNRFSSRYAALMTRPFLHILKQSKIMRSSGSAVNPISKCTDSYFLLTLFQLREEMLSAYQQIRGLCSAIRHQELLPKPQQQLHIQVSFSRLPKELKPRPCQISTVYDSTMVRL